MVVTWIKLRPMKKLKETKKWSIIIQDLTIKIIITIKIKSRG